MKKNSANPYATRRKSAHFTQDEAAERLYVSRRVLSDYENGHQRVPNDIAERMAAVYKSPELMFEHIRLDPVLGKYFEGRHGNPGNLIFS